MNQVEQFAIIQEDPWLGPYAYDVNSRFERYKKARKEIEDAEGSLLDFAKGHYYYGINQVTVRNGWVYREWAPRAHQLSLTGDFNNWDRTSHKLQRNER